MRMDQVAWYCATPFAAAQFKEQWGLADKPWVIDQVTADSRVVMSDGTVLQATNVAQLQFCYEWGTELELIRYISGPHWHYRHPLFPTAQCFISHIGYHLVDDEPWPMLDALLVQETITTAHTGLTGRHYHYRIHEISPGSYVKFIRRIQDPSP